MLTGPDLSNHQPTVDLAAIQAVHAFVIHKATEGVGFTDASFRQRRAQARALKLPFGCYHFARAGAPAAEADYFCGVIDTLAPTEFVVLDWEVPHPNPPAWAAQWLQAVEQKLGAKAWVYINQSTLHGYDWSAVASAGHRLWLAKYDFTPDPVSTGDWALAAKQYTDRGVSPGVVGPVDLNAFYGIAADLGSGAAPTPVEDDMKTAELIQSPGRGIALIAPGYYKGVTPEALPVLTGMLGLPYVTNDRGFDLIKAMFLQGSFADALDPKALAADIVAALPADSPVSPADADAIASKVVADLLGHIRP